MKILNLLIKHKHEIKRQNAQQIEKIKELLLQILNEEDALEFFGYEAKLSKKINNNVKLKHKKVPNFTRTTKVRARN